MTLRLRASPPALLAQLPRASADWPGGEPFTQAMRLGSISLGIFAPRGTDRQTPEQDELYIVAAGTAPFEHAGVFSRVAGGDALFVAAGDDHRFRDISTDFVSWVVFWGPKAGESDHC